MSAARHLTGALALGIAFLSARPCAADDALDRFADGRALLKLGDFAGACAKFRESVTARPTVGALARVAECDERDGHLVRARDGWWHALVMAREAHDDRVSDVETALARLEARLPRVRIVVADPRPEGLRIEIDGHETTPSTPVPLDPGAHKLVVIAPNKRPYGQALPVGDNGGTRDVVVPDLEDERVPPVAERAITPPPAPPLAPPAHESPSAANFPPTPSSSSSVARPIAVAAVAAGAVCITVGAGFALTAAHGRSEASCNGPACATDADAEIYRSAQNQANVATGLFIGGGALLAAGIVTWIVSPGAPRSSPPPVRVVPMVEGAGAGLLALGRF